MKEVYVSFAVLHFNHPLLGVLILGETLCLIFKVPFAFVSQLRLVSISRPSFPKISKLKTYWYKE